MPTQQDELYTAERGVRLGRQFNSIKEIEDYVFELRSTWWWETFYWQVEMVEVGPARKNGTSSVGAYYEDKNAGRIEMLTCHFNERSVIHELAHVLAKKLHGSRSHDPWFAREYANLVYLVLGSDAWLELEAGYRQHGIKYSPAQSLIDFSLRKES